jgi:hypothetical protein
MASVLFFVPGQTMRNERTPSAAHVVVSISSKLDGSARAEIISIPFAINKGISDLSCRASARAVETAACMVLPMKAKVWTRGAVMWFGRKLNFAEIGVM